MSDIKSLPAGWFPGFGLEILIQSNPDPEKAENIYNMYVAAGLYANTASSTSTTGTEAGVTRGRPLSAIRPPSIYAQSQQGTTASRATPALSTTRLNRAKSVKNGPNGTWNYQSHLLQSWQGPTQPLSSGISLSHDVLTGQNITTFATYIYNGIGPSLYVGDGKRYTGTINGEKVVYNNGRINYYLDSNKNNKLDSRDQFKGQSPVSTKTSISAPVTSGTWSMNAQGNNLTFTGLGSNFELALPFARA